jgi:hypothetical protein
MTASQATWAIAEVNAVAGALKYLRASTTAAQEMGEIYDHDEFKCSGDRDDGKYRHFCADPAAIAQSMRKVSSQLGMLTTSKPHV